MNWADDWAVHHMEYHWGGSSLTQGDTQPDSEGRAGSTEGRHGLPQRAEPWKNTHIGPS